MISFIISLVLSHTGSQCSTSHMHHHVHHARLIIHLITLVCPLTRLCVCTCRLHLQTFHCVLHLLVHHHHDLLLSLVIMLILALISKLALASNEHVALLFTPGFLPGCHFISITLSVIFSLLELTTLFESRLLLHLSPVFTCFLRRWLLCELKLCD